MMLNDAEWQGNDESNKNKNLHETWHSRLQNIQYKKRQPKAKLKPIEFIRRTITFAVFVGIRLLGHYYATSWRTSNMDSKLPLLLIVCHYIQSLFVCSCVGLHCGWRAVDIRWFESSIRVLRKWKKRNQTMHWRKIHRHKYHTKITVHKSVWPGRCDINNHVEEINYCC